MMMSKPEHEIRVILADDHAVVRAGIRQFLEHSKSIYVVAEAGDGESVKDLIQVHQPDVVVLDIKMPKSSGIEVTRWIRSTRKDMGILILTAYDDEPYIMAVLQAGANGYVLKTASPQEIIQAVVDVYEGKSALGGSIAKKLIAQLSQKDEQAAVEQLSERELEVLKLAARGYTNKAIAAQLVISDRTVQGHLAHIFNKLQVKSRTEAVMRAVSLGWISGDREAAVGREE